MKSSRTRNSKPLQRCYGYCRVSTTKQGEDGSSLEEQEKKIKAWAVMNDMKLVNIYVDRGVSGTFMFDRPEFAKLIACLKRGDTLVANDFSRVSRNLRDTVELIERLTEIRAKGVFIMDGFDTSTSMSQAYIQITAIMKGIEVKYTSERVRDTLSMMKERGQNITRPVYGWMKSSPEKGSGLIEVPEHQAVIARMKEMHASGKTYYAIAKILTEEGIPTPSGKVAEWRHETVANIIHRGEVAIKGRHDK